jgi:uncharacterized protein YbjT (DUF2867 family)
MTVQAQTLIETAVSCGVAHLVSVSAHGAEEPVFPHHRWHRAAESLVRASGIHWTMIRPNWFIQIFLL